MITVLAVDPGITTGLATGLIEDGKMEFFAEEAQLRCSGLWEILNDYQPVHLIYEAFTFRQGKQRAGIELFSRNLIGVMQLYHELTECNIYEQYASAVMGHFHNERLKEEGLYTVGSEHARDATRHLMNWYTFGRGYEFNQHGATLTDSPML